MSSWSGSLALSRGGGGGRSGGAGDSAGRARRGPALARGGDARGGGAAGAAGPLESSRRCGTGCWSSAPPGPRSFASRPSARRSWGPTTCGGCSTLAIPLPNTFYVKGAAGLEVIKIGLGFAQELLTFNSLLAVLIVACLGLVARRLLAVRLALAGLVVVLIAYMIKIGRDEMKWFRMFPAGAAHRLGAGRRGTGSAGGGLRASRARRVDAEAGRNGAAHRAHRRGRAGGHQHGLQRQQVGLAQPLPALERGPPSSGSGATWRSARSPATPSSSRTWGRLRMRGGTLRWVDTIGDPQRVRGEGALRNPAEPLHARAAALAAGGGRGGGRLRSHGPGVPV